jgi:hypothetical protein
MECGSWWAPDPTSEFKPSQSLCRTRARSDKIEPLSRVMPAQRHPAASRGGDLAFAGIHVFLAAPASKAWMAGTSPAMTPNEWFTTTGTRCSSMIEMLRWSLAADDDASFDHVLFPRQRPSARLKYRPEPVALLNSGARASALAAGAIDFTPEHNLDRALHAVPSLWEITVFIEITMQFSVPWLSSVGGVTCSGRFESS